MSSNELVVTLTVAELKDVIYEVVQSQKPVENENGLMSRFEVMEHFQVSSPTIHRWCKNGTIRKIKMGHKVFFNRSEIEAISKDISNE
jgi:excisionase family DNA binding protein